MKYFPLNCQQMYVLESVYQGLQASSCYQWKPESILGPAHPCCEECRHSLITGEVRAAFEATSNEAKTSNAFGEIYACWNGDGDIIGLFGKLKDDSSRVVMLGEYAVRGSLVSYQRRFEKVYERYRAFWPGRLVIAAMLILSFYFEMPLFTNLWHPNNDALNQGSTFIGALLLAFGGAPAFISLRNYLLLRKQPMEPHTRPI